MKYDEFLELFNKSEPDKVLPVELQSLWWDKKGNWEKSHDIAQDIPTFEGHWIHAYLHRKEGDIWNADYWYGKAGKERSDLSIEEEWESLVEYFLSKE